MKVLAAMSGGVDSSVAAALLVEEGHDVTGVTLRLWDNPTDAGCCSVAEIDDARQVANVLGIDHLVWTFVDEFDARVVAPYAAAHAEGLTPMELGESSALNVGDTAIAIGAPLGLSGTVTDGIVSKLNRTISVSSSAPQDGGDGGPGGAPEFRIPGVPEQQQQRGSIYINVIQTDAAINPGNSGGALIDDEGRLIGINVAIASAAGGAGEGAGNIGVGFSIPVDYAQRVAQDLIQNGEATHGFLGVSVTPQPATPAGSDGDQASGVSDADQAALASGGFSAGARVVEVVSGSPADEAGLKEGDVITGVGDRRVTDSQSLTAVVREYPEGGTATVDFMRDGQEQSAEVTFVSGTEQQ